MSRFKSQILFALSLSALSVACSSSKSEDGKEPNKATGGPDATTCDPDGEIPCVVGKTEPCDDFHTDFPDGDDLCMKPPVDGYQLHVGPTNYDDPEEISRWTLPPGGIPGGGGPDYNWCYYMKMPNDELIYTNGYVAHMRPGSHHYIMFGLGEGADIPDSTEPSSCAQRNAQIGGGANFLSGATRMVQTATMFGDAAEDEGLGSPLTAHQQVNMNMHFVNIGEKPVLQELWVNMFVKPADEVTDIVKAMEWLGGLSMSIAPHTEKTLQSPAAGCVAPLEDTRLLGVTAHMHANTVRVSMFHQAPGAAERETIFDDFNWEEPTVWRFNSSIKNDSPDRTASKSGSGKNGIFMATPNDKFSWECEVHNTQDVTLEFSDKAYSGEMCNVFGMYSSPKATKPWNCYF